MLPSNKPPITAFFHPLGITIDGKFEDATAAILKDIYDSEEEDDEEDEAIEVNANEEDDEDDEAIEVNANEEEDDNSEMNVVT